MSGSTAIALTGILVAGVATVAAPFASSWLEGKREHRRFDHEQRMRDTEELRRLLDESLSVLDGLSATAGELSGGALVDSIAAGLPVLNRFSAERAQALRQRARLAIRVGADDTITKTFALALERLNEIATRVMKLQAKATIEGREKSQPFAEDERIALMDAIGMIRPEYDTAIAAFIDAARGRVGVLAMRVSDSPDLP